MALLYAAAAGSPSSRNWRFRARGRERKKDRERERERVYTVDVRMEPRGCGGIDLFFAEVSGDVIGVALFYGITMG